MTIFLTYSPSIFRIERSRAKFHNVDHHFAHLFSAYYVSPFPDAAVVSVDGFGDFASTVWGQGRNGNIEIDGKVLFPHSLGIFYQALTQYLGFPNYGDEYKVMGLAPYGAPKLMDAMRHLISSERRGTFKLNLEYFTHHREPNEYQWTDGEPKFSDLFSSALEDLLGPRRKSSEPLTDHHRNIAHSAQARYEEVFFSLVDRLQHESGLSSIALAGGCGANSVANGKIRRRTKFKQVYVQAAPGDAGGAIGAAYAVWHRLGRPRVFLKCRTHSGVLNTMIGRSTICLPERSFHCGARVASLPRQKMRGRSMYTRRCSDCGRKSYWMVPRPDGMGAACSWEQIDPLRSTARRHEDDPQCQDKAQRIAPSLCPIHNRGKCQ